METPVGQAILMMLAHQQPLITALVPQNEYTVVYPSDTGTFTMKMDYKEVLSLHEAVTLMKDAGELHFFDEKNVKYKM
jgi:hypothetical protein